MATPSPVVNTCAVRMERPESASAPAIRDSRPGRSLAATVSEYVPGRGPASSSVLASAVPIGAATR